MLSCESPPIIVALVTIVAAVPVTTQDIDPPPGPRSTQVIRAAALQQRADQWQSAGHAGLHVAIGASVVALLYDDTLKRHPNADRAVVIGVVSGMATWGLGGLISRMLRRWPGGSRSRTPSPGEKDRVAYTRNGPLARAVSSQATADPHCPLQPRGIGHPERVHRCLTPRGAGH